MKIKLEIDIEELVNELFEDATSDGDGYFDRRINQAKKFAENALEGKKDKRVPYV